VKNSYFSSQIIPLRPNLMEYELNSLDLEQPFEDPDNFVADISQSTFHIVSFMSDVQSGDGIANNLIIANNQCNEVNSVKAHLLGKALNNASVHKKQLKKSNVDKNIANNYFAQTNVDLTKTFYSDKNCFNFTKNLKNSKKFCQWTPKVNNDSSDEKIFVEKDDKKSFDVEKSSLYQLSRDVLQSLPGMNSLEFFQFPTTPRRVIDVNVIHVYKDMKNGNSSTSSDTDSEQHSESSNIHSESTKNGDLAHAKNHSNVIRIDYQEHLSAGNTFNADRKWK
jgi:hypothetical protein